MPQAFRLTRRSSGLLLHPTSLWGRHGSGDLGDEACQFADFLAAAGQRWWQMLPVGPPGRAYSPYDSPSAFAGNPWLINLDRLAQAGLVGEADLVPLRTMRPGRVRFDIVRRYREARLRKAFAAFRTGRRRAGFERFCDERRAWLDDYALFAALKRKYRGKRWVTWPRAVRRREPDAVQAARVALQDEVEYEGFVQFQFHRQWSALKRYCSRLGIGLIGDVPIFVARESADVWAHQELFLLDRHGRPTAVSGVPPDAFSSTGQFWGHPLYRWSRHRATGYAWWVARMRHALAQFDAVRIDHFLGFARLWAIPAGARSAQPGKWLRSPGAEIFQTLHRRLGRLEIIAEDLGILTPQAEQLRDQCGFPGMRVLQFAFSKDDSYHQPHRYPRRSVVYTGTHDNNTTVGWYRAAGRAERRRALAYTGGTAQSVHGDMIRLALSSVADTAIISVQDLLGLSARARMNTPATVTGNWQWRLAQHVPDSVGEQLRETTTLCGR